MDVVGKGQQYLPEQLEAGIDLTLGKGWWAVLATVRAQACPIPNLGCYPVVGSGTEDGTEMPGSRSSECSASAGRASRYSRQKGFREGGD